MTNIDTVDLAATDIDTTTNGRAVDLIESAFRAEPHCRCGSHTVVVERDGGLSLSCATLTQPMPRRKRLLSFDFLSAHLDRRLLDFADWRAA